MKTLQEWLSSRSLDKRLKDIELVRLKYKDRIPVIVFPMTKDTPDIDAHKFLVPKDVTVGQFIHLIRLRISLKPEQALFVFATDIDATTGNGAGGGDVLMCASDLMQSVYQRYHNRTDDFLYVVYGIENTFGFL